MDGSWCPEITGPSDPSTDINLLESRALLNALVSFRSQLSNSRVDVHIDNKVLKSALDDDGCRNSAINEVVKEIYSYSRDQNFSIQTFYVPSSHNPADEPSWKCSDLDCMLSIGAWLSLELMFGPHSFDLMSLDSNCQKDVYGNLLPHYAPWVTPVFWRSAGINVYANPLPAGHNIYVFPPFILLGPLLRYVIDQEFHGAFTLIVPDIRPRPFWWATIQAFSVDRFLLGKKGSGSVLLFPSQHSQEWLALLCSGTSGRSDVSASKYFCLTVPSISRFQDLGKLPGDVPHVYTLMTLMPTFERLVHGSRTCLKKFVVPAKTIDHAEIAKRFQEFNDVFKAKPYQRQKSAFEQELLDFLASLSPPRDVSSRTSDDIIKFLISKDKSGKTVLHSRSCSEFHCNCPARLAAGSVDSLLGKLRAIFNNLGRLHDSNPVAHARVKEYLKFIREEQAGKAIVSSQAIRLFFVKFSKLISFLRRSIEAGAHLSVVNKYILMRDATFFVVDFFIGDRASDLGRQLANQVFRLKDRKGFLLKFTLTKTFRGGTSCPFVLEPSTNNEVCPVSLIEYYLSVCHFLSIELAGGYMFRTTDHRKVVSSRPFLGSAVNNRLRKHLTGAKIDCGEPPTALGWHIPLI